MATNEQKQTYYNLMRGQGYSAEEAKQLTEEKFTFTQKSIDATKPTGKTMTEDEFRAYMLGQPRMDMEGNTIEQTTAGPTVGGAAAPPQTATQVYQNQMANAFAAKQAQMQNMDAVQSNMGRRSAQMGALRGASGFGGLAQSGQAQAGLGAMQFGNQATANYHNQVGGINNWWANLLENRRGEDRKYGLLAAQLRNDQKGKDAYVNPGTYNDRPSGFGNDPFDLA